MGFSAGKVRCPSIPGEGVPLGEAHTGPVREAVDSPSVKGKAVDGRKPHVTSQSEGEGRPAVRTLTGDKVRPPSKVAAIIFENDPRRGQKRGV